MPQTYKNIIFTNHAFERIADRSISKHSVYETINFPDRKQNKPGSTKKYNKTIHGRKYQVIAQYKSDQKKYLVISTWVRGEDDKQPFIWILITAPFKLLFWIVKKLW